ncbi:MAG: hypothetical protein KC492_35885 [Myxococcales bacterium]|nr:hypothetical protein [Myxococcales bacterium]
MTPKTHPSQPRASQGLNSLTKRQRDVLDLLAQGYPNREIAGQLQLSVSTVKTHVENLLKALGASNRTEAAAIARTLGDITASETGSHTRLLSAAPFEARPAVAVLRFDCYGDDPIEASFAAGLVDDLITLLSKWRWFPVIARSTSIHVGGSDHPTQQLGEAVGAEYLVTGSVRRSGESLRITVRLDAVSKGHTLWSENFDVNMGLLFELQDELARNIVGKAYPELMRAEGERSIGFPTENLNAWELTHQGLLGTDDRSRDGNERALDFFERALSRDGKFMLALYGRGYALYQNIINQWVPDVTQSHDALRATAERALATDSKDAIGWYLKGRSEMSQGNYDSDRLFQASTDINPSFASAHAALGHVKLARGDQSGFTSMRLAARLSPRAYAAGLGFAHFIANDYENAVSACRDALVTRPQYAFGHALLCASLGMAERNTEAQQERVRLQGYHPSFRLAGIHAMIPRGQTDVADRVVEGLQRAGFEE